MNKKIILLFQFAFILLASAQIDPVHVFGRIQVKKPENMSGARDIKLSMMNWKGEWTPIQFNTNHSFLEGEYCLKLEVYKNTNNTATFDYQQTECGLLLNHAQDLVINLAKLVPNLDSTLFRINIGTPAYLILSKLNKKGDWDKIFSATTNSYTWYEANANNYPLYLFPGKYKVSSNLNCISKIYDHEFTLTAGNNPSGSIFNAVDVRSKLKINWSGYSNTGTLPTQDNYVTFVKRTTELAADSSIAVLPDFAPHPVGIFWQESFNNPNVGVVDGINVVNSITNNGKSYNFTNVSSSISPTNLYYFKENPESGYRHEFIVNSINIPLESFENGGTQEIYLHRLKINQFENNGNGTYAVSYFDKAKDIWREIPQAGTNIVPTANLAIEGLKFAYIRYPIKIYSLRKVGGFLDLPRGYKYKFDFNYVSPNGQTIDKVDQQILDLTGTAQPADQAISPRL